jgi:hypothetical protein
MDQIENSTGDQDTVTGPPIFNHFDHVSVPCRDPSGNVIELFCTEGYGGAAELPRGPALGHGTTVDIDALAHDEWGLPT